MPVPGTIGGVTFVLTRVNTFATRIWLAGLALIAFDDLLAGAGERTGRVGRERHVDVVAGPASP